MALAESRQRLLIVLTVAGCLSAIAQLPPLGQLMMGGGVEPTNVALRLARDGTLADPYFSYPTGPTAHVSPLFPIYLAALMKMFGQTPLIEGLIVVLLIFVHTAYPILLWLAGWRLLGCERAGIAAAALAILLPTFPLMPQWDYIYTADFLLLMCVTTAGWASAKWAGPKRPLIGGAVTGLLSLWNASSILIATPWWVYLYRRANPRNAAHGRAAVWFAVGLGLVVAPWAIRNYIVLGSPVFLRGNLGVELAVSNNGLAQPAQFQNLANGSFDRLHPNIDRGQALEIVRDGEAAYNRRRFRQALDWIAGHPRRFAELTAARVFYFWFPYPGEYGGYSYRTWLLTVLALLGAIELIWKRHPIVCFVLPVLVLYPLVFYLVHSSIRLRLIMTWIEVLMAGYAMALIAERIPPLSPWLAKLAPAAGSDARPISAE